MEFVCVKQIAPGRWCKKKAVALVAGCSFCEEHLESSKK
jgi:hypothetical protein